MPGFLLCSTAASAPLWSELRQIHLIRVAPHCINPSITKLLGVCLYMGRIYTYTWEGFTHFLLWKFLCICLHGNPWSLVIHMPWNELRKLHLITGAPHGINRSRLSSWLHVCLYMGKIYAFLIKYQSDGVLLFNEKYANHSHAYKL